jgi:trigger factor
VTIDIAGSMAGEPVEGLTADDYSYELGSATVVPELDDHLRGAKVGDILVFEAEHPDPDEEGSLSLRVLVKEVKEKILPDVDDEWANEASEFETLAELRSDLRDRVSSIKRVQTLLALREGVVSALTDLVETDAPEPLVQAELEHRVNDLVQRLSAQGATVEQYLEATGRSASDLTDELRTQAAAGVKADLALRAVIEAEGIDVDDDELAAEITRIAERVNQDPVRVRRELERAEQMQAVRSDLRKGKALEWLVEHAEVVDEEGAAVDRADLEPDQLPTGATTAETGSEDPAAETASPEASPTENEDE